jgi:hypothetical protein
MDSVDESKDEERECPEPEGGGACDVQDGDSREVHHSQDMTCLMT